MKTFKRIVIAERNHRSNTDRRKKKLWIVAEYRDENNIEYRKAFEFDNKAHVEECNFPLNLE